MYQSDDYLQGFTSVLRDEYPHLVRLCRALTRDADAAEDLVQETLVEAWRNRHKLWDMNGLRPWLAAIARHVCRRWMHHRVYARRYEMHPGDHIDPANAVDVIDAGSADELLERAEVVQFLRSALAQLPAATRSALIAKYLLDYSHEEIAFQLGVSANAVTMRLQRGRRALQRIVQEQMSDDGADAAPQPTQIWCPYCGHQRLLLQIDAMNGVAFRCATCSSHPAMHIAWSRHAGVSDGVQSPKVILNRLFMTLHREFQTVLEAGSGECVTCGRPAAVHRVPATEGETRERDQPGIYLRCPTCYPTSPPFPTIDRTALNLTLPATQRFWRTHPRMHVAPDQFVSYAERPAVVTRYHNHAQSHELAIISDRDTFIVLAIHETPARAATR
jgi:RNA polymerase sigma factor (sigma-70 family)